MKVKKLIMNENINISSKTTNNKDLNSELITRTEIEDSPFTLISINESDEHFATMGEYRITDKYDNLNKAKKAVEKLTWNRIIQVTMILIEKLKEQEIKQEIK